MAEKYEEIVRKWYSLLRRDFTDILMERYRGTDMRLDDVRDIYEDVFIEINRNLREGRIGTDWHWRQYIIRIGLNMASKRYRAFRHLTPIDETDPENDERLSARAEKVRAAIARLNDLAPDDAESEIYRNPEAQALLGEELGQTPEPCASIIRLSYFSGMTDEEIAAELAPYRDNGKALGVNAKAIKARRWLCMRKLKYRVKVALYMAGIIDEKPVMEKRNGK